MGWILEPGQSTILHTLSAEGTIREVSGLPTGVSTRPALPVDLAAGDELALVASQTPALGTLRSASRWSTRDLRRPRRPRIG